MVNDLMVELVSLSFSGFLLTYLTLAAFLSSRKRGSSIWKQLYMGIVPVLALGIFMTLFGVVGEFTAPLPGGYNTLFYEPYTLFGLAVIAFAGSLYMKTKLKYVGFFGFLAGLAAIFYGYTGYSLGMTKEPLLLFLMYLGFGLAGIFALPVARTFDSIEEKMAVSKKSTAIIALFWIFLIMGSLIALGTFALALSSHLAGT